MRQPGVRRPMERTIRGFVRLGERTLFCAEMISDGSSGFSANLDLVIHALVLVAVNGAIELVCALLQVHCHIA
jgi:hypothetical protein